MSQHVEIRRLGPKDIAAARGGLNLFGEVFEEQSTYARHQPDDAWLAALLAKDDFVFLTAREAGATLGALTAYVLDKYEQPRREIYIYDLGVAEARRREGIATALIAELQRIAGSVGAYVIFVQAEYGDDPAIALYEKLGTREEVLHFDIPPAA